VLIGDAGDQGIWRDHGHLITPHKETKRDPLSPEERQENRVLAYTRLRIEHVIQRLKIFRVLKDVYRHRRRRFSLRANLIAALCNHSLTIGTPLTRVCKAVQHASKGNHLC